MGSSSRRGLMVFYLLVLLVIVVGMLDSGIRVSCALSPSECKEERRLLMVACNGIVAGKPASAYCCVRIRVTHVEKCVCPIITPKLAPLIDANINRAIRVIQGCGRQVPRHFKCGSITTP